MNYSVEEIAVIVSGKLSGNLPSAKNRVTRLLIDSRMLISPEELVFVALKTPTGNGHDYISSLYKKNVFYFLTEEDIEEENFPQAVFIKVENTLDALQQLALHHRNKFIFPVIGITGSNGKTIVKEWLYQLLNPEFDIIRSPGSYNSQIGVPLSILNIETKANLAIFEAGVGKAGDMDKLEKILHPEIGIFTSIGDAHSAGFRNIEEKIAEKLKLFSSSKKVFINVNDYRTEVVEEKWRKELNFPPENIFLIGNSPHARLRIISTEGSRSGTVIHAEYHGKQLSLKTHFTTPEIIDNILTCWAVMLDMDYNLPDIQERILELSSLPMRLEIIKGVNSTTIINDAYSADKESFKAALKLLEDQKQHKKRTVIMGSLEGSSQHDYHLYNPMLENMKLLGVSRLFFIGKNQLPELSGIEIHHYKDTAEFIKAISGINFSNESVLIKGARKHHLEDIIPYLQLRTHRTILEINLDALANNIRVFREIIGKETQMMAMVKAFSYGSGSYEIARILEKQHVNYLAVAYTDEGIALRRSGITIPIMVMNADLSMAGTLFNYQLEPVVFSENSLLEIIEFAENNSVTAFPVHLELDTGMHRLGIEENDLNSIIPLLKSELISLKSVFTHLAASEDEDMDEFTKTQLLEFERLSAFISKETGKKILKHALNSAGIIRHPEARYDMVRLGLGMYGITTGNAVIPGLEEISVLKTRVSQVRKVKAGDTIGYNRKGAVKKDSTIATVSIGYADGYPIQAGEGKGFMVVNGRKAPVTGKVCMDMTMIDVTGIPDVREGTEVVVFGKGITVKELAAISGTIPYDILTGVASRVKRVYFHR